MPSSRTAAVDVRAERSCDPGTVGLTIAGAARRVGVAATTLRAWDRRYALGPSERTSGGHRRYSPADVARLQRLQQLVLAGTPTATAASLVARRRDAGTTSTDHTPTTAGAARGAPSERFAAAITALDPFGLASAADAILTELGAMQAWTKVFMPQLQALGQRWEDTNRGVEREHATAFAVRDALGRHADGCTRRSQVQVLTAATPGEGHTLPLDALAAALAETGVASTDLGSLPKVALHTAITDTAPAVVLLWARSRQTADLPLLRSLLNRAPVVYAAGPGWRPARLPNDVAHVNDLGTAVDAVLAWTT